MESLSGTLLNLASLHPGSWIDIETKNRRYKMECLGGNKIRVSGHPEYCPQPVPANVQGSLSPEGSLEVGLIGRGMRVVFFLNGNRPVTTSKVLHVRVERAGNPSPLDTSLN